MGAFRKFLANSSGSAGAELALILPFVLILILGTLEGGHYMYLEHKVAKGVRDGARYAARLAFSNYDCASNTISSAALTQIRNITRTGFPDGDNPVFGGTDNPVISGWTSGNVTAALNCATAQGGLYAATSGNAPRVRVNASVPYPALFIGSTIDPSTIRLRAVAESAVMGI